MKTINWKRGLFRFTIVTSVLVPIYFGKIAGHIHEITYSHSGWFNFLLNFILRIRKYSSEVKFEWGQFWAVYWAVFIMIWIVYAIGYWVVLGFKNKEH